MCCEKIQEPSSPLSCPRHREIASEFAEKKAKKVTSKRCKLHHQSSMIIKKFSLDYVEFSRLALYLKKKRVAYTRVLKRK